jgi:hypothetical protein
VTRDEIYKEFSVVIWPHLTLSMQFNGVLRYLLRTNQ